MKVTKAQAQANRAHIIETASTLFREHGYDGVGVADLMAAAGFTHGGFYKHFRSKADLMAESAACGMARTAILTAEADPREFVRQYLARAHRDNRATGCTMAALGGDAARQPEMVKATFAAGIESLLAEMGQRRPALSPDDEARARARSLDMLAHAVGAVVLSRACPDDSPLADEILEVCRDAIVASLKPPGPVAATPSRRKSR
ncbi:TetR/AcrR family transcriptional regulator [Schlegelella sp. S2-27]|uniref:TetR/AcrR family transcriptional regulator n=1 Tax=Caldimonas mangrovi TaxID=2944811 RepID=A0ABT0YYS0_9BURK|nr:TetR family transcriptional regulator [Caldimonas mangrovi]MCM5682968.1 TetR/AcrR family transcriptional regulator [Caldimonas mangrovi]